MLGKLERRIKKLNGNIVRLDREMTMKDIERQIREYNIINEKIKKR